MHNYFRWVFAAICPFVFTMSNLDGSQSPHSFSIGVEVQGNISGYSWAFEGNDIIESAAVTFNQREGIYLHDALSKFEHRYQDRADDILSSGAGKFVVSYLVSDDVLLSMYAGAESAVTKGKSIPQLNAGRGMSLTPAQARVVPLADIEVDEHVPSEIQADFSYLTGIRALYNNVGVALQYSTSRFSVKGYRDAADLNGSYDDNQVLFGFYGQTSFSLSSELNMNVFIEGLSNFYQDADQISELWHKHAAKSLYSDDETPSGPNYEPVSLGNVVSIVHKFSIGLGVFAPV